MNLIALQFQSHRLSAWTARRGQSARLLPLRSDEPEVSLAISLETEPPLLGRDALALRRTAPHLLCTGFVARLGDDCQWRHGRLVLDPVAATRLVFRDIAPMLEFASGIILVVPSYLQRPQVERLGAIARESRLPVLGALPRCLAGGLASFADHPWHNLGILIDVDEQALVCSVLRPNEPDMHTLGQRILPELSLRIWKEKLLAGIAERCVQLSRHDPRESAAADQMAYDQLEAVLEASSQSKAAALRVQGEGWFQAFSFKPSEAAAACQPLARLVGREIKAALRYAEEHMTTASIFLTAEAARLPGLVAEIYRRGENRLPVVVLPAQAPAQAALEVAQRIHEGDLAPGFHAPSVPLPTSDVVESSGVLPFPSPLAPAVNEL